jgi:hypothetical protein
MGLNVGGGSFSDSEAVSPAVVDGARFDCNGTCGKGFDMASATYSNQISQ